MPHWECGISFRLFFQVLKSVSYHFCDIKFSVLVKGSSQKVGGNLFSCTRDQHKVLEGNLMPQPFSVWRMAKSLDSIKIKSENQGPWREFGACSSISFWSFLQELHGNVQQPSPPGIWSLFLLQQKTLGQGASSGEIAGLKSRQGENLGEICCSKCVTDTGNPVLGIQAAAGDVISVSN